MSDYRKTVSKGRRLAILQHLEGCQERTSNGPILQSMLNGVGYSTTRTQLITELAWLQENEFVTYQDNDGFIVAEATRRGLHIANGNDRHPEIDRPSARS